MLKEFKEVDNKLYIVHIYKYIHVFMCPADYSIYNKCKGNNCYAHTHTYAHTQWAAAGWDDMLRMC